MTYRTYSLAGESLALKISEQAEWAHELLREVASASAADRPACAIWVDRCDRITGDGLRQLEAGVFIGQQVLVDLTLGIRLDTPEAGVLRLQSDRPAMEWLMWLLHLAALRAGAAFVHGAGVERGGEVVLFPSWGGVGKTAVVTHLVRNHGWRLLGDDVTIVQREGTCWPFPKPMVLYPYHRGVFPDVFAAGRGPVAPVFANTWLTAAAVRAKPLLRRFPGLLQFVRRHNPQSVRIEPSSVFGTPAISQGGRIQAVIWLERLAGLAQPGMVDARQTIVSRIIGSTLNEYDARCVRLTNIALGLGLLDIQHYWSAWQEVLRSALSERPQYLLYLPASMPLTEVSTAVEHAMRTVLLPPERIAN